MVKELSKLGEDLESLRKSAQAQLPDKTATIGDLELWYKNYLDPDSGRFPTFLRELEQHHGDTKLVSQLAHSYMNDLAWEASLRQQDIWWRDPLAAMQWMKRRALRDLEAVTTTEGLDEWRTRYLGRERGELTGILKGLGKLPGDQRKAVGQAANALKTELEAQLEARGQALRASERAAALERERLDVTLPGRPHPRGHIHPLTQTIRDIGRIFRQMGFYVVEGPDVETDYYNFQALNMPQDHPARDMQDTFWVVPGEILLRTQTSPNQIRVMETLRPPVRVIVPGKVYRHEATDASHEAVFHQVEGLLVDETCTMANLRGVVERFAREMFGAERKVRFRPSYFPFTEPSAEFDMDCATCGGTGCRICKYSGWLEMGGSGEVNPRVLRGVGYDPAKYRGFAFGLGIERIAMLRHSIDDMRLFTGNDLRFLRQFS